MVMCFGALHQTQFERAPKVQYFTEVILKRRNQLFQPRLFSSTDSYFQLPFCLFIVLVYAVLSVLSLVGLVAKIAKIAASFGASQMYLNCTCLDRSSGRDGPNGTLKWYVMMLCRQETLLPASSVLNAAEATDGTPNVDATKFAIVKRRQPHYFSSGYEIQTPNLYECGILVESKYEAT